MELVCVEEKSVWRAWPLVSDLIKQAMRRGNFSSFGSIQKAVLEGRMVLWLVVDNGETKAAVVTQVSETEWRRVCDIIACGGKDMSDWLPLIESIEKYAREMGCKSTRIIGREGWIRMLPQYRPARVVLERTL